MNQNSTNPVQIPLATYRLQFNRAFTFLQAAEIVPYLAALGISHCYASPFLRARPGSMHGYDIIDHNSLNPEIGSPAEFDEFVSVLNRHGMGQILDIVPNHMGVMGSDNAWWLDVLENGEASPYAEFFDIDWQPVKDELQEKVLIPVLGDQYGNVLEKGELRLWFDQDKGEFSIFYEQHRFPINPREYPRILNFGIERLQQKLGAQDENLLELQSLVAAFRHLPARAESDTEQREERIRDKTIHKRRLSGLSWQSPAIRDFIQENVSKINGMPGDPRSFDELHELIKGQAYRLAYWRVAADDINYRRFFDINDLAGIRMEKEVVFEATHRFVFELLQKGKIHGLRIDHPDGLYDPLHYFYRLQSGIARVPEQEPHKNHIYVVVEKILTGKECLPDTWPVNGTTGYDFVNLVNGLFIDSNSLTRIERIYRVFTGQHVIFPDLVYQCKKFVMRRALASELNVLANLLSRIALSDRHTCDFTLNNLRDALSEIIARFPVYRTYVTNGNVAPKDRAYIEQAVRAATRNSSAADTSVFDFIKKILLTDAAKGHPEPYQQVIVHFAMKFQQFTSVVMAKGLEDTAFYRYNRFVSLNEVGGDPAKFGTSPEEFHGRMQQQLVSWPLTMLATSTHDTKRSEDVRARLNVLSEIPALWRKNVRRWREINREKKHLIDGQEAPSRNDEYLLYQTLVGAWPLENKQSGPDNDFQERIKNYILKAVREAKDHTSWADPSPEYEDALTHFVKTILSRDDQENEFLREFLPFQNNVSRLGMLNSLSQTLIKLSAPGVPDIYQGMELWNFTLVDPDNRRRVNYSTRIEMLEEMRSWSPKELPAKLRELCEKMEDGRIKLYLTWKALSLRKQYPTLFREGNYQPLRVLGSKSAHIFAYARSTGGTAVAIAVPRLCAQLLDDDKSLADASVWRDPQGDDTQIELPAASELGWRNIFNAEVLAKTTLGKPSLISVGDLLGNFPVALLVSPFKGLTSKRDQAA
jgi:(1->4)-alpha-D-glucan 1-alpha-D-glucosylmutase